MKNRITIPQVAKSMGVIMDNKTSWSVGSAMASMYEKEFGELPPKDLRPKTNGPGSHCFALYPANWQSKIEDVIRLHQDFAERQGDLFGDK